jgi:hypothetical protein
MTDETPSKGAWPGRRPNPAAAVDVKAVADRAEAMPRAVSLLQKMKARPNWDDATADEVGEESVDRLKIPRDIIDKFARDGVALQWITRSVRGQDAPQEVSKFVKGGWTPVHSSDFDGAFDGMFMPKGSDDVVGVDDCMLVARPMEIHKRSKERERHLAAEPLRIKMAELGAGLNIPGGSHPSAVRQNRINITREGIEVPVDALGMTE